MLHAMETLIHDHNEMTHILMMRKMVAVFENCLDVYMMTTMILPTIDDY